ncbi:hypothetical protein NUH30_19055 [Leptospira sp. 85282-16]|uniref:hypothetical protein n=1 Tax=Leptospira TaxID=171 RepID=UPI0010835E9C|nr:MULTISPECIES: hypothetical protein [Leptospira]MCT8335793.1 hypothetical protein [Leptospira sp. 85282-16]TGK83002.1 hypothetical protein EHQ19_08250 [Leptospira montravelensis]
MKTILIFKKITYLALVNLIFNVNCLTTTNKPIKLTSAIAKVEYKLQPLFVRANLNVYNGNELLGKNSGITQRIFKGLNDRIKQPSMFSEIEIIQLSSLSEKKVITPKNTFSLDLDYELYIPSLNEQMFEQLLGGSTFLLIPTFNLDRKIILNATLKGIGGEVIKKYNSEFSYSHYRGILIWPFLPLSVLPVYTMTSEAAPSFSNDFTLMILQDIYINKLIPIED